MNKEYSAKFIKGFQKVKRKTLKYKVMKKKRLLLEVGFHETDVVVKNSQKKSKFVCDFCHVSFDKQKKYNKHYKQSHQNHELEQERYRINENFVFRDIFASFKKGSERVVQENNSTVETLLTPKSDSTEEGLLQKEDENIIKETLLKQEESEPIVGTMLEDESDKNTFEHVSMISEKYFSEEDYKRMMGRGIKPEDVFNLLYLSSFGQPSSPSFVYYTFHADSTKTDI